MLRPLAAVLAGALFAAPVALAQEDAPGLPRKMDDFTHIHSLVIADEDSPLFGFHHFYLGKTGWTVFKTQDGFPYPEGTTFLGAVYKVATDGAQHNEAEPRIWTQMVKDPSATDTGGWRFAAFEPDGTLIEQDEKTACFECHTKVADSDFVFSHPLEMKLPEPQ